MDGIYQPYIIDLSSNNNFVQIPTMQGDGNNIRGFKVELISNGVPYVVDAENTIVSIAGTKPDTKHILNECSITDEGYILVDVTSQMSAVKGRGDYCIVLIDKNTNSQLKSFPFYILTTSAPFDISEIVSSDEFQLLTYRIVEQEKITEKAQEIIQDMTELESTVSSNETRRIQAENTRVSDENKRINAETSRVNAEKTRTETFNNLIDTANTEIERLQQENDTASGSAELAKQYADSASSSAASASTKATAAANSATNANNSANAAKTSETNSATNANNAKQYADSASSSAASASASASTASQEAASASTSASNAATSATNSKTYSDLSKSYAVGTNGSIRTNDNSDNAKYYYEQAKAISEGLNGALLPMGTITFSNLAIQTKQIGYMYNISDSFTTTSDFKEGAGIKYPAGTNVYWTGDGKWDCLAGVMVTGIKGNAETSYRTGDVNITMANLGYGNIENKSSATIRSEITSSNISNALGFSPISQNDTTTELVSETEPTAQLVGDSWLLPY